MSQFLFRTGKVMLLLLAVLMVDVSGQQPPAGRGGSAPSQAPAAGRGQAAPASATLFFREEWKQPPYTGRLDDAARRATPEAVANPNLEMKIYGPCKESGITVYGSPKDSVFPLNLWTGACPSPVAITLRDKNNYVDLTGSARIKWATRAQSLHFVSPVLKLANGVLIVGSHADITPVPPGLADPEMVESEFSVGANRWYILDAEKIVTTKPVESPDLSKVDEVGFADLMAGGGHGSAGWINVGPFEVYGKPVKR